MGEREWDLEWSDGSTTRWDDASGYWRYEPLDRPRRERASPPSSEVATSSDFAGDARGAQDRGDDGTEGPTELEAFDERESLAPEPAPVRTRAVPDIVPEEDERRPMWPAIVAGAVVGLGIAAAVLSYVR